MRAKTARKPLGLMEDLSPNFSPANRSARVPGLSQFAHSHQMGTTRKFPDQLRFTGGFPFSHRIRLEAHRNCVVADGRHRARQVMVLDVGRIQAFFVLVTTASSGEPLDASLEPQPLHPVSGFQGSLRGACQDHKESHGHVRIP
jgi:hypothetical protein